LKSNHWLADRKFSLLPHVQQDCFHSLQTRLRELSQPSPDFFVLLAASTVIATLGLYENSAAVIIGAMIIAPLMRPLLGLAFGSLTADNNLLGRCLITLSLGSAFAICISYLLGLTLQALEMTPEILARTRPTLLDLGVAAFAGAVGAYCQTRDKLSDTLSGVAIAVALVPPLSVIGIGLAQRSAEVAGGAALLYATNLVGITIAAAMVFLVLGYTPLHQARRGLIISTVTLSLLIVPLAFSMRELILENQLSRQIKLVLKKNTVTFKNARLRGVEVRRFKHPIDVIATVYGSEESITSKQITAVETFLAKRVGTALKFHVRIIPSKEITGGDAGLR
jgi:uncharacterized hydrophobic protein (TIGR00271 family)